MNLAELVRRHQATGAKLSSYQDFSVLDQLLVNAMTPLEAETTAYFEWLAEVAAFTVTSRRRSNESLVSACVVGLCGGRDSPRAVSAAGIDRAHVFALLNRLAPVSTSLEEAQVDYARRHGRRVPASVLEDMYRSRAVLGPRPGVVPATRAARYWHRLALRHKADILSHYMRLLFKVSSRVSHASGNRVEVEPAFADAYLTASEAVDRFRADRGVFASYLSLCLKGSSRESASHALGLAAPGARVASADALQADAIDGALEIGDPTAGVADRAVIVSIDAVSSDPDVRAALMLSELEPPEVARLRADELKSARSKQPINRAAGVGA